MICGEDRPSPRPSGLLVHPPAIEAESDIAAAPGSQALLQARSCKSQG